MNSQYEMIDDPGRSSSGNNDWVPLKKRESLSILHILGICASMLTYQVGYSIIFPLGTPLMTGLGLTQPQASIAWLIGPITGFFVQPLIGYLSDGVHFKMGRRRPFLIIGTIGSIGSFLIMYFVKEIGQGLSKTNPQKASIGIFILSLFILFLSLNTIQVPARAIVGDIVPEKQQVLANNLGSWIIGVASTLTYFIGGFELVKYTKIFVDYQLIFVVGLCLMAVASFITCMVSKEEQYLDRTPRNNPFKELYLAFKTVPKPVFRIAIVYFFSWMAYYPVNVNTTSYIARDVYKATDSDSNLYKSGVNFGMMILGIQNCVVLIYSPFQKYFIDKIGLRWTYAISQIVAAACVVPLFFIQEYKLRWVALALFVPLGLSCTVFNSIPFAIIGLCVAQERMAMYMGVLNSACVLGQEVSNVICLVGFGAIKKDFITPTIAAGALFSALAAIMCYWVIVPDKAVVNDTPLLENNQINDPPLLENNK